MNFDWLTKINTTWIDLKSLPHKLKERVQILQQVFIEFKHRDAKITTLNWI